MQEALHEDLTEFIRHYLIKDVNLIKQGEVCYALKEIVSKINAIDYLTDLKKYSVYYQRMKYPEYEKEPELAKMFKRLNILLN